MAQGDAAQRTALELAEQLRDALPGRGIVVHCGSAKFKTQFRRADESGARLALIVGDDELARGVVALKPLRGAESTQIRISRRGTHRAGRRVFEEIDVSEYSEAEQWNGPRHWLKTNGLWIIAGIAIGAGGFGGWRWYQERRDTQAEAASARYEEMVDAFLAQ